MTEPDIALPTGPLLWGQAGVYDAIDDRLVVTALSAGTLGLVRTPTLTPGAGLSVNIGRWHGVADCGDGTNAVIGTRDAQSIDVPAGGAALRTDVLFAEVDPDSGQWTADLYTESEVAGLLGLRLGTIGVPAGANGSAQFDLRSATVGLRPVRATYSTAPDTFVNPAARNFAHMPALPVQAGRSYWFRFHALITAGPQTNISGYIVIGGPGLVATAFSGTVHWNGPGQQVVKRQPTFGNNTGMNSGNFQNAASYWCEEEGFLVCGSDGNVVMAGAASGTVANGFTVQPGATLIVADITAGGAAVLAPIEPGEPGRIITGSGRR